ncbi:MAG: extracellular solute-binding protein [Clostridiales bacterium]|nr:extracellular solute-binding protein [Clostridiales bacterium]
MTKKTLAIILAAMMLIASLAACGDGGTESKTDSATDSKVESTVSADETGLWDLGDENNITLKVWGPSTQQELLGKQVEAFKALYPDLTMDIEIGQCEESEAQTQVRNDIEAAADIFAFPSDHLENLVSSGSLGAVVNYGTVTAANDANSVAAATYDDILYAYPLTADNSYIIFYDKTVLGAEDVTSLDKMCEVAAAAGKKIYVDAGNGFYACIFSFTGGLTMKHNYADGTETYGYTTDENAVVASIQAFGKLFQDGTLVAAGTDVAVSAFTTDAAAIIDGTWDAAAIKDLLGDNMGAAKLPTISVNGEDKQIINLFGYKMLGVKSSTAFPKTAHALAEYLSGAECQTEKATELSIGPSNLEAAKSDAVVNNEVLKAVNEQSAFSIPQTSIAGGFWNAHKALGEYISAAGADLSDEAIKAQLDDCLEATNDI